MVWEVVGAAFSEVIGFFGIGYSFVLLYNVSLPLF